MSKIILDLCGGTGSWSKPYRDAGYDVRVITLPRYNLFDTVERERERNTCERSSNCARFRSRNPEWNIAFRVGVCGEAQPCIRHIFHYCRQILPEVFPIPDHSPAQGHLGGCMISVLFVLLHTLLHNIRDGNVFSRSRHYISPFLPRRLSGSPQLFQNILFSQGIHRLPEASMRIHIQLAVSSQSF